MDSPREPRFTIMEGAGFTWVLEHLLAYPGTYEIPLRTMYTLNCSTQKPPQKQPSSASLPGNAFPRQPSSQEDMRMTTQTAAAQLKTNLIHHITQLPSQPASLPPSFITSFVRRCFPAELDQVDFPQALTALDYLKDLEVRRRREVVSALNKLGIAREDLGERERLAKKYPGVIRWIEDIEIKERKVEALYTQIYIGIRRWTIINELSLEPFNKPNCIAMLNTLYPPTLQSQGFVQPTVQLTAAVLSTQRQGFFRYISAVERNGPGVLGRLMEEHRREGEMTGWPSLRETLDSYLRMANSIIDESYEVTGSSFSPTSAEFSFECDEDGRRKVDSGISFGSNSSSNRNSGQSDKSHATRPSTSSSVSAHSRKTSRDKQNLMADDDTITSKTAGSTLERIARELKRMKSRSSVRDQSSRKGSLAEESNDTFMLDAGEQIHPPASAGRQRTLSIKRSLRNMRSRGNMRDDGSRPSSRADEHSQGNVPAFDAEEMRRRRMIWEAQQGKVTAEN
ncbi:uncharacterized protein HMPREF1541_01561 [Cyphellophora europaea CBS 101466]|uniref:Uncharacterized protein n=1 Tax=Cyphellophora europaea (strain CBS 101466) TaxID=1220924 RepID=W2S176_CYPE1|nr:uncharacterized protein HMPREF1541_01561 [Cyphellophora europaea CBS 101466]ETN42407.1 hypothetical protein HMPREF1541_01561 [Cyphellophora europaea CBS 101466]